jgi:hypothetical protein
VGQNNRDAANYNPRVIPRHLSILLNANAEVSAPGGHQTNQCLNRLLIELLSYHRVLPAESLVWAVTKTNASWGLIELETQALTDKVRAFRCGLDDAEWEGIGREAQCAKLLGVGLPGVDNPFLSHCDGKGICFCQLPMHTTILLF